MGKIEGDWLEEEQKLAILVSIEQASTTGISQTRTCAMWMINRRRVVRWLRRWKQRKSLANGTPGPQAPGHRLLPQERTAVVSMATQPTYADLSHRILAVTAWDLGLFFVSFSSVYRILCSEGLMGIRGHNRHHNGQSLPPLRKEINGSNQRWCWDISYLRTYERGVFLYLYLLLDEFSRKALNWLISWHQRAEEAKELLEGGFSRYLPKTANISSRGQNQITTIAFYDGKSGFTYVQGQNLGEFKDDIRKYKVIGTI